MSVNSETTQLTGINSVAANPDSTERIFGTGTAEFKYKLNNIECSRTISVLPSHAINKGVSAFLLTVETKNNGSEAVEVSSTEGVEAHFTLVLMFVIR